MPRDRALLDWLRIDRHHTVPFQHQLAEQLHAAIKDGRLLPGIPLPSSRLLAADLSVSRGTVMAAYDRLIADGLLEVHRSGSLSCMIRSR